MKSMMTSLKRRVVSINKTKGLAGSRTGRKPLRRCVSCREMKEKASLIRVIRGPDGGFNLDETGKSAGRGAYVCKTGPCLQRAVKTKGFDRSFKQKLPGHVYAGLEKVACDDE